MGRKYFTRLIIRLRIV